MLRQRVVVGAIGDDERAREVARRLRDEGQEVVYAGADQTPEQLVRAAVAEDATTILVDGDAESLARVADLCAELDAGDVVVTPLDVRPGAPRSRW